MISITRRHERASLSRRTLLFRLRDRLLACEVFGLLGLDATW
jgi:hypothetical protein